MTLTPPAGPAGSIERRRLLLVDDDDAVRRSLQLLLHWRGYDVRSFASATPVMGHPDTADAPLLIADNRLPDGDGLALLAALRAQGWHGRAIMITGFPSPELHAAARASGYDAVLEKPLRRHELLAALGDPTDVHP
ncbi:MAG: response regulator [Sphingomonas sp.]